MYEDYLRNYHRPFVLVRLVHILQYKPGLKEVCPELYL
jgi:hypothetical protein